MAPLGLEPWYSRVREEGNMACSLSPPPSMSCSSSAWGKPNMKRADRKSKAPQRRKPPHHAPIQRGSSGVMSSLPEQEIREFTTVNGCPIMLEGEITACSFQLWYIIVVISSLGSIKVHCNRNEQIQGCISRNAKKKATTNSLVSMKTAST